MIALKNILCPLDLSLTTDSALSYAIALARAYEAKLYLCHCLDNLPKDTPVQRAEISEQFRNAVTAAVHNRLDAAMLGRIEAVLVEGDPRTVLPQIASQYEIDLIVMRARRRPIAAALLGSVTESVCHNAPCSVLVTHNDERDWKGISFSEAYPQHILVASDFSPAAETAFEIGLSLAQEYQAELELFHVLAPAPVFAMAMSDAALHDGSEIHQTKMRLRAAVPADAYLWCKVKEVVREGSAHREILRYVQERPFDLICLGAHGEGAPFDAIFGSNADRVLRNAPCPVLIAHPSGAPTTRPSLFTMELRLWPKAPPATLKKERMSYESLACY